MPTLFTSSLQTLKLAVFNWVVPVVLLIVLMGLVNFLFTLVPNVMGVKELSGAVLSLLTVKYYPILMTTYFNSLITDIETKIDNTNISSL